MLIGNRHLTLSSPIFVGLIIVGVLLLGIVDAALFGFLDSTTLHGPLKYTRWIAEILLFAASPYCIPMIIVLALYRFIRAKSLKAVAWIWSVFVLYGLVFFPFEYLSFEYTLPYFEFLRLELSGGAEHCISSSIDINGGKKLDVCTHFTVDDRTLSIQIGIEEKGIVYDSSDQILLPKTQRSSEWLHAAQKMTVANDVTLAEYDKFEKVTPLAGHFYYVAFETW